MQIEKAEDSVDDMLNINSFRPPRRDGMALGFGLAFVVFGMTGMGRGLGIDVKAAWLYPVLLIGLGAAGLVSLFLRERR
jgi:hypothetical protein